MGGKCDGITPSGEPRAHAFSPIIEGIPPRLTKAARAPIGAAPAARFVVWQKPQPDSGMGLMILVLQRCPAELGPMRET
jgi:hypothetical protein